VNCGEDFAHIEFSQIPSRLNSVDPWTFVSVKPAEQAARAERFDLPGAAVSRGEPMWKLKMAEIHYVAVISYTSC
jgi:hypothetical protein